MSTRVAGQLPTEQIDRCSASKREIIGYEGDHIHEQLHLLMGPVVLRHPSHR